MRRSTRARYEKSDFDVFDQNISLNTNIKHAHGELVSGEQNSQGQSGARFIVVAFPLSLSLYLPPSLTWREGRRPLPPSRGPRACTEARPACRRTRRTWRGGGHRTRAQRRPGPRRRCWGCQWTWSGAFFFVCEKERRDARAGGKGANWLQGLLCIRAGGRNTGAHEANNTPRSRT